MEGLPAGGIPTLLGQAAQYLARAGVIKPRLNAEQLLSHCTGRSRAELYARHDRPLSGRESEDFAALLGRRAAREPLQYITGLKGFRYLELAVDPRVLIPRPETEMLVERALCLLARRPPGPVAVDVGTGCGCIALSLAYECTAASVFATEVSGEALEVARLNASRMEPPPPVTFLHGDLLQALPAALAGGIDLIVSNPPYIREGDFPSLPPEVRDHEPYAALVAGPTGMEVHLVLMRQAPRWLAPGGCLLMEGGEDQVHELARAAAGLGYAAAQVRPDLTGRPRMAELRVP